MNWRRKSSDCDQRRAAVEEIRRLDELQRQCDNCRNNNNNNNNITTIPRVIHTLMLYTQTLQGLCNCPLELPAVQIRV